MNDCLSEAEVQRYLRGEADSAELVPRLDAHLLGCESCREAVRQAALVKLCEERTPRTECLDDVAMARYVAGRLSRSDSQHAEAHIGACRNCAAAAKDLREFRDELRSTDWESVRRLARRTPWWESILRQPGARLALANAAPAVLVACVLIPLYLNTRGETLSLRQQRNDLVARERLLNTRLAALEQERARLAEDRSKALRRFQAAAADLSSARAALDAARQERALTEGVAATDPGIAERALTAEQRALIARSTQAGWLEFPRSLSSLAESPRILLGSGGDKGFALLWPRGEVIATARPVFRWEALPGATAYQVTVVDEQTDGDVWKSPKAEWQPGKKHGEISIPPGGSALKRGRVYRWYVTAILADGREVDSPGPSEPAARFQVLSRQGVVDLDRVRRSGADYREKGVIFASLGLLTEAEKAFGSAQQSSPHDSRIERFLKQIRVARRLP